MPVSQGLFQQASSPGRRLICAGWNDPRDFLASHGHYGMGIVFIVENINDAIMRKAACAERGLGAQDNGSGRQELIAYMRADADRYASGHEIGM